MAREPVPRECSFGFGVVAFDEQLDIELGRRIIAALGSKRTNEIVAP
ncbi:MAG TPA: hypothetical protein VHD15_13795 [Hyphomicrobiales bacterium]|nr:hypothetical protein [Hyphomicrobiales bacterium]